MRLRGTLLLVLICATVAGVGAWTDRPHVDVAQGSTAAVPATKPWNALVEISRHGRRLDGFRPTMTIEGMTATRTFTAEPISAGKYRVSVIFPRAGYYNYTVKVANRIAARGTVYAIPD
jgi:hypothetical protein